MTSAQRIEQTLLRQKNPDRIAVIKKFFKTGPGEYGEGDEFLGIGVPTIRALIRNERHLVHLDDVQQLFFSPYHEVRLAAVLFLVLFSNDKNPCIRTQAFETYCTCRERINNWDLVDLSAPQVVGKYCFETVDPEPILSFATSSHLWTKRIAMVATFHYIKNQEPTLALKVAELLLTDPHDLLHKAIGWMLREIGKRCGEDIEEAFLKKHCANMPRTCLRYAIERFPKEKRQQYLTAKTKTVDNLRKQPLK